MADGGPVNSAFKQYEDEDINAGASGTGDSSEKSDDSSSKKESFLDKVKSKVTEAASQLKEGAKGKAEGMGGALKSAAGPLGEVGGTVGAMGSAILSGDKGAFDTASKNLTGQLNSMLSSGVSTLTSGASDTFSFLTQAGGSFLNQLKDKVIGALLSKIHIPESVYLAGLVPLDAIRSNPDYNNKYIRNLLLKRDLNIVLEWLDKSQNTRYTNTDNSSVKQALTAAHNGCINIAYYIMGKLYDEEVELLKIRRKPTVEDPIGFPIDKELAKRIDSILLKARENMHSITRAIIMGSYSNLMVSTPFGFTDPTGMTKNLGLRNIIKEFNIHPSAFGDTDKEFGKKFQIKDGDVNKFIPFYKAKKTNKGLRKKTKKTKEIEKDDFQKQLEAYNEETLRTVGRLKDNGNTPERIRGYLEDRKRGEPVQNTSSRPPRARVREVVTTTYYQGDKELTEAEFNYKMAQQQSTGSLSQDLNNIPSTRLVPNALEQNPIKYINPRNFNIKKIYLYLISKSEHGMYYMNNKPMYIRLKYPVYSTLISSMDSALAGLFNVGLGKMYTNAISSIESAMYDYTKKVENYLYDPKKVEYLSINDMTPLPEPDEPPPTPSRKKENPVPIEEIKLVPEGHTGISLIVGGTAKFDVYLYPANTTENKLDIEILNNDTRSTFTGKISFSKKIQKNPTKEVIGGLEYLKYAEVFVTSTNGDLSADEKIYSLTCYSAHKPKDLSRTSRFLDVILQKPKIIAITAIELDKTTMTLNKFTKQVGGVVVNVIPSNADVKLAWALGADIVKCKWDSQNVLAINPVREGHTVLTITANNNPSLTAQCTINIENVDPTANVSKQSNDDIDIDDPNAIFEMEREILSQDIILPTWTLDFDVGNIINDNY